MSRWLLHGGGGCKRVASSFLLAPLVFHKNAQWHDDKKMHRSREGSAAGFLGKSCNNQHSTTTITTTFFAPLIEACFAKQERGVIEKGTLVRTFGTIRRSTVNLSEVTRDLPPLPP